MVEFAAVLFRDIDESSPHLDDCVFAGRRVLRRSLRAHGVDGSPFFALDGTIVSGENVLVIPGPNWYESGGRWQIRGEASLICQVRRAPESPLIVELTAGEAPVPMLVLWDDVDIAARMASNGERSFAIEIPARWFTPGTHELTLIAERAADRPTFPALGYRIGSNAQWFSAGDRGRFFYASSLLSRGVTGIDDFDTLGGLLFRGPQTRTLPPSNGPSLSTTIENGSFHDAEFRINDRGIRLRPLERRAVTAKIAPNADLGAGDRIAAHGLRSC